MPMGPSRAVTWAVLAVTGGVGRHGPSQAVSGRAGRNVPPGSGRHRTTLSSQSEKGECLYRENPQSEIPR